MRFAVLPLLLLCGCVSYQSRFEVAGNHFSLPKDAQFSWLQVSIPTTNGPVTLVISNAVFKMNPAVIDAKTAHDQMIMRETAALMNAAAALK